MIIRNETIITRVKVETNRREAIRRGINGTDVSVDVDLDVSVMEQGDRNEIAARLYRRNGEPVLRCRATRKGCRRELGELFGVLVVSDPIQSGVLEAIHDEAVEIEAAKAKQVMDDEAEVVKYVNQSFEYLTHSVLKREGSFAYYRKSRMDWEPRQSDDPRWIARVKEVESECNRVTTIAKYEAIAKYEEKQAKKALIAQDETTWISDHGSSNLQRMVAEDMDFRDRYDREHQDWENAEYTADLATHRPGWIECSDDLRGVANLSDRAWVILDAARLIEPTAMLRRRGKKLVAVAQYRGRQIIWPAD